MTSLFAIPFNDIILFFHKNNIAISPDKTQIYTKLWQLIQVNGLTNVPSSIVDWITAYNLSMDQIILSQCKTTEILLASDIDLLSLTNKLSLSVPDKHRIIRILGYLGLLINDMSVFDSLPYDVIQLITHNLDYRSLFSLCKVSKGLHDYYKSGKVEQTLKLKIGSRYNLKELEFICQLRTRGGGISANNNAIFVPNQKGDVYIINSFAPFPFNVGLHNIIQTVCTREDLFSLTRDGHIYVTYVGDLHGTRYTVDLDNVIQILDTYNHTLIPELHDINQIMIGYEYEYDIFALTNYGAVFSIKETSEWHIKIFDTLNDKIQQISTSPNHMLLLNSKGQVYARGRNNNMQLGFGDNKCRDKIELIPGLNNIISVSAGLNNSLALTSDGEIYVFGQFYSMPCIVPNLKSIVQIQISGGMYDWNKLYNSVVLTNDGRVIKFKSDGSHYMVDHGVCEIFYNSKILVKRTNDDRIKIDSNLPSIVKLPK